MMVFIHRSGKHKHETSLSRNCCNRRILVGMLDVVDLLSPSFSFSYVRRPSSIDLVVSVLLCLVRVSLAMDEVAGPDRNVT